MTTEKLAVTPDQAAEAFDSLDDFARMGVGVDARGPRKVLEQFIEQARAALAATPAPAPQWTPEAVARTLALAEELRNKIKVKPDDEAGQGKEASNG